MTAWFSVQQDKDDDVPSFINGTDSPPKKVLKAVKTGGGHGNDNGSDDNNDDNELSFRELLHQYTLVARPRTTTDLSDRFGGYFSDILSAYRCGAQRPRFLSLAANQHKNLKI